MIVEKIRSGEFPKICSGTYDQDGRAPLRQALIVLLMHVRVQLKLGLHGGEAGRLGLELIGNVIAFSQLLAAIRESLFAEVVDLLESDAFKFKFAAEFGDEGINGVLFAFGVEDDQSFVFALHMDLGRWVGAMGGSGSRGPAGGRGRAGLGRGGSAVLN